MFLPVVYHEFWEPAALEGSQLLRGTLTWGQLPGRALQVCRLASDLELELSPSLRGYLAQDCRERIFKALYAEEL